MAPQRRTHRADTRAARALLLPQLLAGTGNFGTALGLVRTLAQRGAVVLDRLPQQSLVHLVGANSASASSIEPTFSPFKFKTSTFAIVFFFCRILSPALNLNY